MLESIKYGRVHKKLFHAQFRKVFNTVLFILCNSLLLDSRFNGFGYTLELLDGILWFVFLAEILILVLSFADAPTNCTSCSLKGDNRLSLATLSIFFDIFINDQFQIIRQVDLPLRPFAMTDILQTRLVYFLKLVKRAKQSNESI